MVKASKKYLYRSFKHDFSRLLAIIVIVLLGVGFLVGLLQTGPDLQKTSDSYFKKQKLYDISLVSSKGITEDQYKTLKNDLKYDLSPEVTYESNGNIKEIKTYFSITYMHFGETNDLELIQGTYPTNENECLVLTGNSNLYTSNIGDEVSYEYEIIPGYKNEVKAKIVGKVRSPKYVTKQQIISLSTSRLINSMLFFDLNMQPLPFPVYTNIDINLNLKENCFSSKYEKKIEEVKKEISSKISDTEFKDELIMLDRLSNQSFNILKNDIEKILTVSKIFPLFFFIITVLVSSTSISRVVSKDRLMCGTLKALGYHNHEINKKFLLYASLSSLVGIIIGILSGLFILPYIIYILYTTIYHIPPLIFSISVPTVILISSIILLLIISVTMIYAISQNSAKPAELLLEKAPKPGKKILLERIKPIWKILPFRFKSMFRNIFRFKKNLIMMLIGVGGSSALLVAGFGMSNSLQVLTDVQYKEIFKFDIVVELNDSANEQNVKNNLDESSSIAYLSGTTINDNSGYSYYMLGGEHIENYVKLEEFNSSSVIVTKQLQRKCNIKVGEDSTFVIDGKKYSFKVTGTTENYVSNYVYIGMDILKQNSIETNALIGNIKNVTEEKIDEIASLDEVKSVFTPIRQHETYDVLLSNLTYIILILIVLSGLLMITVVYNLVDININERKREISTLKVLGYQKIQLVFYIFREIIAMTIMGLALGLGLGAALHKFIITAIESPGIVFGSIIHFPAYAYSILLTLFFSIIVTLLLSRKINKINMVEALKSNE